MTNFESEGSVTDDYYDIVGDYDETGEYSYLAAMDRNDRDYETEW